MLVDSPIGGFPHGSHLPVGCGFTAEISAGFTAEWIHREVASVLVAINSYYVLAYNKRLFGVSFTI